MKTVADFKKLAVEGAKFNRRFIGDYRAERILTVAHRQTNAIASPPNDNITCAMVKGNPGKFGSWLYFPKAKDCRFEDGEMIILDVQGRDFMGLKYIGNENG